MDETAINASGLTKFYGRHRGIVDLDLGVEPGEVFGYLGPNGAGKTTTIRLLLDYIRPTRGTAASSALPVTAEPRHPPPGRLPAGRTPPL